MSTKDSSNSSIKILNRKRGSLKTSITKLASFLESDQDKDPFVYETKLQNLQKIKITLSEIKNAYFEEVDDTDLDALEGSVIELEDECERLEVSLKKILTSSNKETVLTDYVNCSEIKTESPHIKLPEIPLPKFTGQYQDWQNFKMQFENIIHVNDKLTDNQKLYYLKSTLSGAAAEIITLDDSYSSLFKALSDRFDNKRLICNSHLNEILSLDIPNQESAKGLRFFLDTCQKHIRALKSSGLELNKFSEILLINILVKKLDKESRKQYELSLITSDLPKWSNFIDFLEKRCLMLENLQAVISTVKPKQQFEPHKKSHSFLVKNESKVTCIACKGAQSHPLFKCASFLKLEPLSRFNLIKNTHCINCLSNFHKVNRCSSNRRCTHCSLLHNSLLHFNPNAGIKSDKSDSCTHSAVAGSSQQSSSHKVRNSETQCDISVSLHTQKMHMRNKVESSLLPTIVVYVRNKTGARLPIRCLCDSGSENNLISSQLANDLGLKKNKNNMTISGINGNKTQIYSKIYAEISNVDESFSKFVELLVIPKITDFIPSPNSNFEKLNLPSGLRLADPNLGEAHKIDILLSASFLFEILEAGKYTFDNFIFQNSKFGYIATSSCTEGDFKHKFCGLVTQNEPIDDLIEGIYAVYYKIFHTK